MLRYLVKEATKLFPLQEGDYPQPISFLIPDVLDMTDKEAQFTMEYDDHSILFTKSSPSFGIDIVGQLVTINLAAVDTMDKAGIYHWWLRVTDNDELITVGYGKIQINKLD